MALSTYTDLQASVASWLHRTDLTSVIVDCILLAEEKFNRKLRTRHQEMTLADTAISSYRITIPDYTVAVKQLWLVDGAQKYDLSVSTLEGVVSRQSAGAEAGLYTLGASVIEFDGTGTVGGVLYRTIPDVATNETNWLLTAHPSVYLYSALEEAATYMRDDQAMAMWGAKAEMKIAEVNRMAARDAASGPARVRVNAYTP
jgi:hypothetical protein